MRINVKKSGILLILFLFGFILITAGFTARFGLVLAAILTPEYLKETD